MLLKKVAILHFLILKLDTWLCSWFPKLWVHWANVLSWHKSIDNYPCPY